MKMLVFYSLGLLITIMLFCWMVKFIQYQLTSKHLKITLFGICLRRIRLNNIESISKRRGEGWAENWWSSLKSNHRTLVIRKRRGLIKNVVITPKNRYVLKAEMERAIQELNPAAEPQQEQSSILPKSAF